MAHRLQNVYAKSESSPGTPIAIDATSSLECDSMVWRYIGEPIQRTPIKSSLGGEAPAPMGPRHVELDLSMEMKVASSATTPPEYGRILCSAGMLETIGGANVVYTPQADPNGTATDYALTVVGECDLDGNTYAAYGVRYGDIVISHRQGERMMLTAKGLGGYTAVTDQGVLTSPTSYGTLPYSVLADASGFLIHTKSLAVSEWSLSIPIKVTPRPHGGGAAASGYHRWPPFVSWSGNPILTCTVEAADQTAFPVFASWAASTAGAISIVASNGTRTLTFAMPATYLQAPELVDQADGCQLYRLSLICARSGSTAALTITAA